jgi:hypothetical protein
MTTLPALCYVERRFFTSRAKAQKAIAARFARVDGKILRKAPEAAAPEALPQRRFPALPSPIEGDDGTREFPVGTVED